MDPEKQPPLSVRQSPDNLSSQHPEKPREADDRDISDYINYDAPSIMTGPELSSLRPYADVKLSTASLDVLTKCTNAILDVLGGAKHHKHGPRTRNIGTATRLWGPDGEGSMGPGRRIVLSTIEDSLGEVQGMHVASSKREARR